MRRLVAVSIVGTFAFAGVACGGDDDGGSAGSFCDKARTYEEQFADEEDFSDEAMDAFQDLASSAPSEIKEDVELVVQAVEAIANEDFSALEDFDEDAMTEANDNIEQYLSDECGIDTSGDDTSGDDSSEE